jgi:hypothetical protein
MRIALAPAPIAETSAVPHAPPHAEAQTVGGARQHNPYPLDADPHQRKRLRTRICRLAAQRPMARLRLTLYSSMRILTTLEHSVVILLTDRHGPERGIEAVQVGAPAEVPRSGGRCRLRLVTATRAQIQLCTLYCVGRGTAIRRCTQFPGRPALVWAGSPLCTSGKDANAVRSPTRDVAGARWPVYHAEKL